MLARLSFGLPFIFIVPDGAQFPLQPYEDAGYLVVPRPPLNSDVPVRVDVPANPKMNNSPAFVANAIAIDFHKEIFDRTPESPLDPPSEVLTRATTRLLKRLRYVTRGLAIRPVALTHSNWRLSYLNDDGTELEKATDAIRARGGRAYHWSFSGVDADIWAKVNSLGDEWEAPPWDDILLDANAALPHVGTAVVLGATGLEVFIANILDRLAIKSAISPDLWNWINRRGNWLKDPSTDEQFDRLLKLLSGHSLKERTELWEAFQNLRTARNSFVHEGTAVVGGKAVDADQALKLLARANEVVSCVRDWLPPELRWVQFELTSTVSFDINVA